MSGDLNALMLERVDAHFGALKTRFIMYLETVYFPVSNGKRQALFTEELSDREEFLRLQEAQRKALLSQSGEIEPDIDAVLWQENRDGAQERYAELAQKFQGDL